MDDVSAKKCRPNWRIPKLFKCVFLKDFDTLIVLAVPSKKIWFSTVMRFQTDITTHNLLIWAWRHVKFVSSCLSILFAQNNVRILFNSFQFLFIPINASRLEGCWGYCEKTFIHSQHLIKRSWAVKGLQIWVTLRINLTFEIRKIKLSTQSLRHDISFKIFMDFGGFQSIY